VCSSDPAASRTSISYVFKTIGELEVPEPNTPWMTQTIYTSTPTLYWGGGVAPFWKVRSEERRVGKECRDGGGGSDEKTKNRRRGRWSEGTGAGGGLERVA